MDSWKKYGSRRMNLVSFYRPDEEDTKEMRLSRLDALSDMCGGFDKTLFGAIYERFAMRLVKEGNASLRYSDRWADDDHYEKFLNESVFEHTRTFHSVAGAGFVTAFAYVEIETIRKEVLRLREIYPDVPLMAAEIPDYNFLLKNAGKTPFVMCGENDVVKALPVYEYLNEHRIV